MLNGNGHLYEFEGFRLDPAKKVLWRDDEIVRVTPKAVELLIALVERRGDVLTRDEMLESVWQGAFVEEANINFTISNLRKALGPAGKSMIETVPRRGYRFTSEIRFGEGRDIVVERHAWTHTSIEEIEYEVSNGDDPPRSSRFAWFSARIVLPLLLVPIAAIAALLYLRSPGTLPADAVHSLSDQNADSFANDDRVVTDFGFPSEKGQAAVSQLDGKIVVGGWAGESLATSDFAFARYNADGSLDRSFGRDGKLTIAPGPHTDIIYSLAIQFDGRIIAAGVTFTGPNTRQFCVVRLKPDGALDSSFDGDGIVSFEIGNSSMDTANAVAVQPDGKIVVAGSANVAIVTEKARLSQNDFALARLNPDGSLDASFGEGGKVTTDFGLGGDVPYSVAISREGKILLAGVASNGVDQDFALTRYQADGKPDDGFGKGGKVRTDFFDEGDVIGSVMIQPDGKILAAGYAERSRTRDVAVARYSDDGSLDNTFDGDGKATADIFGNDIARGIALRPDGEIVICVYANHGSAPEFAFARLQSNGTIGDRAGSRVRLGQPGEAFALAMTNEGHAVLAGSSGDAVPSDFALVRVRL